MPVLFIIITTIITATVVRCLWYCSLFTDLLTGMMFIIFCFTFFPVRLVFVALAAVDASYNCEKLLNRNLIDHDDESFKTWKVNYVRLVVSYWHAKHFFYLFKIVEACPNNHHRQNKWNSQIIWSCRCGACKCFSFNRPQNH